MFPAVEPFASGLLAVDDRTEIYWETSGNPTGKPAVHLHVGLGGGVRVEGCAAATGVGTTPSAISSSGSSNAAADEAARSSPTTPRA